MTLLYPPGNHGFGRTLDYGLGFVVVSLGDDDNDELGRLSGRTITFVLGVSYFGQESVPGEQDSGKDRDALQF